MVGQSFDPGPGQVYGGRYSIISMLGVGGFGSVWLAEDQSLKRQVVVKVMHRRLVPHGPTRDRFRAEAQVLERLVHPSIVRILEAATEHDPPYIVMEYVQGRLLQAFMATRAGTRQTLPLSDTLSMVCALGDGVASAHEAGVVHRDLKPANVILERYPDGLRILDFGVAKLLDADAYSETTLGRRLGTMMYWAPEQALGQVVGPATDQFALATIAYELMTLRRAWTADPEPVGERLRINDVTRRELMLRIVEGPRPRVERYTPDVGGQLDAVLSRAWARLPEDRYGSVREFCDALAAALSAVPSGLRATLWQRVEPSGVVRLEVSPDVLPGTGIAELAPQPLDPTAVVELPPTVLLPAPSPARRVDAAGPSTRAIRPAWRVPMMFAIGLLLSFLAVVLALRPTPG